MKFTTYYLSFFLFLSLLVGCKDDEVITPEPLPQNTEKPPVAHAGNDTTLVLEGRVILDGTATTDPADKTLTYAWSLKTKPEGSTAALENAQEVKAYFTPDLAGSYTFEFTANNGKLTAKDEVKATVTNVAYAGCVSLEDNITSPTTLAKIAPEGYVDYFVKEDITVYAKLTIEPGVIIEFEENKRLYIDSEAEIIAKGNEANKILFTGKVKEKGSWRGIELSASDSENNLFEYCEISFTGSADHVSGMKAGLSLRNGAKLSIKNTTISNSRGYGMVIPNGGLYEFANNTFTANQSAALYITADLIGKMDNQSKFVGGNGREGIEVKGTSIRESVELIWPAFADGSKYFVMDQMNLYSGVKVQEGAMFEFAFNTGLYIDGEDAYFIAKGTEAKPIIFTGIDKESGSWKGIEFSATKNLKNQLAFCQISYAGSSAHVGGFNAGISLRNGAKIKITKSVVEHTEGYGMVIGNGDLEEFASNTFKFNSLAALRIPASLIGKLDGASQFSGSNGLNGVEVSGAQVNLNAEQVWPAFEDGSKYRVVENITLYTGVKVQEGAILEFATNTYLYVDGASAYLLARGTADKKIIFTGAEQTNGFWKGLEFSATINNKNELSYCEVSYGGSSNNVSGYKANIGLRNGAQLKVFHSHIIESGGWGISERGGALTIDNARANTFANNTAGDVYTSR